PAPTRSREPARSGGANRRPEHPRMYLRPTPVAVDPSLPGSTRRQQISVRPGAKDTTRGHPPPPKRSAAERAFERAEREASERVMAERASDRHARRERAPEPVAAPSSRPAAARPRAAMV